jgi:ribosomal protein S18 acetylase RimI-like enzyme
MNMNINIYLPMSLHADQIAHLEYMSFGNEGLDKQEIIKLIKSKNYHFIVAGTTANNIVGYIILKILNDGLVIEHINIDAEYQKQNIGTMLVNKAKTKMNFNQTIIAIEIPDNNTVAHLFFKSCDFVANKVLRGDRDERDRYRFIYKEN